MCGVQKKLCTGIYDCKNADIHFHPWIYIDVLMSTDFPHIVQVYFVCTWCNHMIVPVAVKQTKIYGQIWDNLETRNVYNEIRHL